MSNHIHLLSEQTINLIAAGEVIENPSSVVKELVDNALDSGAKHIEIEIIGGGFQLIRVSDDGSGMSLEDAKLCLLRHATSKLRAINDLERIRSMGFRGEALASIAAVSDISIETANSEGTRIHCVGGGDIQIGRCARRKGTTVEVRNLFYNVPARREFQSSPSASQRSITALMQRYMLARPDIGFRTHVLSVKPTSFKERTSSVMGSEFLDCGHFYKMKDQIELTGYVGLPRWAKSNRNGQFLALNQRIVQSEWLSSTVRDAMGTMLDVNRYPVFIFNFEIPMHWIDVNVHPQKLEVRFREKDQVEQFIRDFIRECFDTGPTLRKNPVTTNLSSMRLREIEKSSAFVLKEESGELPIFDRPFVIGMYGQYALVDAATLSQGGEGIMMIDLVAALRKISGTNEVKTSGFTERDATEILGLLLKSKHSNLCPMGKPIMGLIDEETREIIFNRAPKEISQEVDRS